MTDSMTMIGSGEIHSETLKGMINSPMTAEDGTRWAAYQNHDLGSSRIGHLTFLAVGPACTYKVPPSRMPDTEDVIGWRYVYVGIVDFATERVIPKERLVENLPENLPVD